MGILNVTPDSFYDGGRFLNNDAAKEQVDSLLEKGADLLDLGAESSRPGSARIPAQAQLARLDFALGYALDRGALVSVDTTDPQVADACLRRGAHLINDVSCLRETALAEVVGTHNCWLVVMHSRVPMSEMRGFSDWPDDDYGNIVQDVSCDWERARERAQQAGVMREKIIFDPGFGFSKNARHSFELLKRLQEFSALNAPVLSGPSRKSFLTWPQQTPPSHRMAASLAAAVLSAQRGAAILRVHDVFETRQALSVLSMAARFEITRHVEG